MPATTRIVDFTQGSIVKNLVLFSVPILTGELLQNLYNSVDALVVGNFTGDNALAAVTVSGFISQLIVSFFNGMSVGSNVVVSRAFGANDQARLNRAICVSFTFAVVLGVLLSALGILLSPKLLQLAATRREIYADALMYLRIYLAGIMFTVIYNSGAGILRAVGDSRTPFRILFVSCTINIILDVFLVEVLDMGVTGAAVATVFSQFISVACVYTVINRSQNVRCIQFSSLAGEGKQIILSILDIGVAAGMQGALISISNLAIARYINHYDTASIAGIGIAQRIDKFIVLPVKSFGITMTTYVSQNLGAQRYDRIRKGFRRCIVLSLAVTLIMSATFYLFVKQAVALFNPNPQVIGVGVATLKVFLPFIFFMTIRELLLGILRGYGRARMPMLLSLIGMIGIRQCYLFVTMRIDDNIHNIFWCYPIAWGSTAFLLLGYVFLVRKKLVGLSRNFVQPREETV